MIHTLVAVASMASAAFTTAPLDGTHAGELAGRFINAQAPTRERVTGWTSGRCYRGDAPNQSIGAALVYETRDRAPGHDGPIFDHPVTKMFVTVHDKSVAQPDLFDNPSPDLMSLLTTYVDGAFVSADFSEVFQSDNAETSFYGVTRYDLRIDHDYAYVRVADGRTNFDVGYCYFFRKIR